MQPTGPCSIHLARLPRQIQLRLQVPRLALERAELTAQLRLGAVAGRESEGRLGVRTVRPKSWTALRSIGLAGATTVTATVHSACAAKLNHSPPTPPAWPPSPAAAPPEPAAPHSLEPPPAARPPPHGRPAAALTAAGAALTAQWPIGRGGWVSGENVLDSHVVFCRPSRQQHGEEDTYSSDPCLQPHNM